MTKKEWMAVKIQFSDSGNCQNSDYYFYLTASFDLCPQCFELNSYYQIDPDQNVNSGLFDPDPLSHWTSQI
jgi:hypothetical protein